MAEKAIRFGSVTFMPAQEIHRQAEAEERQHIESEKLLAYCDLLCRKTGLFLETMPHELA